MPVDFYYKGLREEEHFYPYTPEQSAAKAKGTLYEAWFDVLKASPTYLKATVSHVFDSTAVSDCYELFGDLREIEFSQWWIETGYKIFAEQVRYEEITSHPIKATTTIKFSKRKNVVPRLLIEVPLNLDPRKLKEQFDEILRKHTALYDEKFNRWDHSTADAHLDRDAKLDYRTIKHWLDVYIELENKKRLYGNDYPLYKVCQSKRLSPKINRDFGIEAELPDKEKVFASNVVSDILKKVTRLMAHSSEKRFPCTDDHPFLNTSTRTRKNS